MRFVKMEGLGNDFIVVDGPFVPTADQIVRWCDRRFGIGADGVLEISRIDANRIRMRYWNADGGEVEMCGNGLRCLAALAYHRGWVDGPDMIVETAAGELPASVKSDGTVRALVGSPRHVGSAQQIAGVTVHPVSIGNPHAVVFVDDSSTTDVVGLGHAIEHDGAFPERTNVEFVAVAGEGSVVMRVWERGVGETLASGTGATAAAFAAVALGHTVAPVDVQLPGGHLTIELKDGEAWMIGPANVVYEGVIP